MRDFQDLWAHSSTVICALVGCIPCSYKLIVQAPVGAFPSCARNERPEQCLRLLKDPAGQDFHGNPFIETIFELNKIKSGFKFLIVGDGNMSFSKCLFPNLSSKFPLSTLVASTFFSQETLLEVYPGAKKNIDVMNSCEGVRTEFCVDATKLLERFEEEKFDLILFNFPCVEGNIGQDAQDVHIEANRNLVENFLKSASQVLVPNGFVGVTHKTKEPFSWWKIPSLAENLSDLVYDKSVVFDKSWFPSYKPRKVKFLKSKRGKNSFPVGDAVVHIFRNSVRSDNDKDYCNDDSLWKLKELERNSIIKVTEARLQQIVSLLQLDSRKKKSKKRKR